ncbi:hypothetical protein JCM14244_10610 [Venenivibrio stagnispumantis]|uniref:Uncharacterized protein n=1 Tax=Venenivibrio stagnispumantis TaxID=407998 RepID=A0AA45WKJ6_9AQUI|nr:hypothetical protein [Venenivibrio stagnispumantis]MCW4573032.1 hypothetical protein [Venenivibrio stagnispumantis]SMP07645.1 hypothetical protein SAMN06264868_10537 [Venenivibrio stagnispumantis]
MAIQGEINEEVISTLVNLSKNILGENLVNQLLNNLKSKEGTENLSGKDIVFAFADKIQEIFGNNGGYAIIRQLAREVTKVLQENNPREEWEELLEKSLNTFGFAHKIERSKDEAYICNCVFYPVLKEKGYEPIKHSVCWFGLGFIEGFVRKLEEDVKGIKWVERDIQNEKCKFIYLR